ncbi:MAG TPA: carboxypeptidase regulatory-like domain-containing protein [Bryobacteraceae bacterium]|nr:carboxypeptidase regulatory-like domain-containing protein [Bryobacteraceae bacterium]
MKLRTLALVAAGTMLFAFSALAQTASLEGNVKGEDGKPLQGAVIKIDRTDIKGHYQVKTDKKGHYLHAGLPSTGTYDITVAVNGQDKDGVKGVRLKSVDMPPVDFDLSKSAAAAAAGQAQAQAAQDATRGMSAQQKAEQEKQMKEREEAMKKNKELNDAFNAGIAAAQAKQWDQAIQSFTKASELDPKQHVVWAQLAEAQMNDAEAKKGADADAEMAKALDAYNKAIELKPDDAGYHNNFALSLAKAKKFPEAQAELTKAATLDPPNAGRYYYNLGALLVNSGQNEPAGEAFKKAIESDPNYADAQYQYGVYLLSKATIAGDGKVTPVPGTADAFQKYLALKPDGPFADSAKSMLQTLGATVDTSYKNPKAESKKGKK